MRKLVLVTLALVMIVSLSMEAVSAGWYGDVHTNGYAVGSEFYGKAWGTKYLASYTGHGLVKVGEWNGSGIGSGVTKETTNPAYSGDADFEIENTRTGSGAYCLSEVTGSDGRSYAQNTYH